jgi:hypothetical protein
MNRSAGGIGHFHDTREGGEGGAHRVSIAACRSPALLHRAHLPKFGDRGALREPCVLPILLWPARDLIERVSLTTLTGCGM